MSYNFGTGVSKTTGGFTLGTSTAATTTAGASTGFTLGGGDASANKVAQPLANPLPTPAAGLVLQPKATPATATVTPMPSSGFTLGTTTPAAPTNFSLGTAAPSTGFSLGGPNATTASTAFSLGGTTAADTGFLAATSSTAAPTGFGLLGRSSTTSVTTAATVSLPTSTTPQTALGTCTVVTSASTGASSLNFVQLEEHINKWTLDLEEQEKIFTNQATQVNAWDRLLITNGEKIVSLNSAVEQVKLEQQHLDHELDFILSQQRELEDCIAPLEKELSTIGFSDPEREHTYQMAENIDTQLKQMSEDLKEIIEHLNESNRNQDTSDPIVQIGRILNAHMNSLQWIDQSTAQIGSHLEHVSKLHDIHRRENERSFHLTYD